MITLQTLEGISIETLLETFNLSFSDYVIPLFLTKEQLENKIKGESVKLEFSVGAFEGNQLIAFVLHGYGVVDKLKIAYNAGTGVIPAKRGNRIIAQLYAYALPIFLKNNVSKVLLEVITTNEIAIKAYTNTGFEIIRHFTCFKGAINASDTVSNFELRELKEYNWHQLRSFWDFRPSWQNSSAAVEKLRHSNVSIGVYENENLLGYAIYNPIARRIYQLAVDKNHRKKGIGAQLLQFISTVHERNISIINVDNSSKEALEFVTHSGMNMFIKQYEMELNLKYRV